MISICLALSVFLALYIYSDNNGTHKLVIESPQGKWIYSLEKDLLVHIPGKEGDTIVSIVGKKVSIIDSPCSNKTCVAAHPIEKVHQWIACLPNQVFVKIEGKNDNLDFDIVSY